MKKYFKNEQFKYYLKLNYDNNILNISFIIYYII